MIRANSSRRMKPCWIWKGILFGRTREMKKNVCLWIRIIWIEKTSEGPERTIHGSYWPQWHNSPKWFVFQYFIGTSRGVLTGCNGVLYALNAMRGIAYLSRRWYVLEGLGRWKILILQKYCRRLEPGVCSMSVFCYPSPHVPGFLPSYYQVCWTCSAPVPTAYTKRQMQRFCS